VSLQVQPGGQSSISLISVIVMVDIAPTVPSLYAFALPLSAVNSEKLLVIEISKSLFTPSVACVTKSEAAIIRAVPVKPSDPTKFTL
jgi:hypothetical protein